jgi:shikimate dehydrogenase
MVRERNQIVDSSPRSLNTPDGDVELCISVASRPGRFGVTVHNAGYRALGLNFLYKAFRVDDIGAAMAAVRTLGIRGCGVSMPFKAAVVHHLDELEPRAAVLGAVNTVVNDGGRLIGYNTDVTGARAALEAAAVRADESVLVLGAGGAARAVIAALTESGCNRVTVAARQRAAAEALASNCGGRGIGWDERLSFVGDVVFNATPIGMAPDVGETPIDDGLLQRLRAVIDVVATPPVSLLVQSARDAGRIGIDGLTMALFQAAEQFRLYTGFEAPISAMRIAADGLATGTGVRRNGIDVDRLENED